MRISKILYVILAVLLIATLACNFITGQGRDDSINDWEQEEVEEDSPETDEEPTLAPEVVEVEQEEPVEEIEIEEPTEAPQIEEPVQEANLLVCEVPDVGGINDHGYNAFTWKGIQDAGADFPGVEGLYIEAQTASDYDDNINIFMEEGCDLIVSVGFLLADDTAAAAESNPDQLFAIVDVDYISFPNIQTSTFAVNEASFLNGYLAAGLSKTGKLGTYAGMIFPATSIFINGYVLGVEHYNTVHGTNVVVIGWDVDAQDGIATGDFGDTDLAREVSQMLVDEGVDIIMPVAGPAGYGTLEYMQESGTGLFIGVDSDWSLIYPESSEYILSSVTKNMDVFVYDCIAALVNGESLSGNWTGTLGNGGVGMIYSSYWADLIPQDLTDEIIDVEAGIINGSIETLP